MPERLACCVPFCRRTRGIRKGETSLPGEWICGDHWQSVPRRLKVLRSAVRRRERRGTLTEERAAKIDWRIWCMCKRAAIEAAGCL